MTMEASRAGSRLRLLRRPADRAFEQLYAEHARDVYQYALAVLANPTDAEDVTQTTFLNAYRAFQRGERPNKPHNWLIAIAHNVCRMRWRAARSRPREVALEEAPEPIAHGYEPPQLDEVLTALAALSFNQRAALVMRELEGRSYREIADVLGLSTSAVEALLFRARRRLQLDRKSLGAITSVPLPGSLTSFLGGGGGVVAAGGAAIGADFVLKAVAVVVAGVATAAAGYKGVDIVTTSMSATRPQQYAPAAAAPKQLVVGNATARAGAKRTARPAKAPGIAPPANATAGHNQAPAASAPGGAPVTAAASSVAAATSALPQLPQAPLPTVTLPVPVPTVTTPPLPVTVPTVTTPQLPPPPPLPVSVPTVTTPQLPPPPTLPPLPPLPRIPPN